MKRLFAAAAAAASSSAAQPVQANEQHAVPSGSPAHHQSLKERRQPGLPRLAHCVPSLWYIKKDWASLLSLYLSSNN